MRILPFTYLRPTSIDEAVALLAEHGAEAAALAGGTDLVPRMKQLVSRPKYVVDIRRIGVLQESAESPDGGLRIGAGNSLTRIAESPTVKEKYPALAEAALRVGSTQLRNSGTLGGNICLETRCWYYNQSHAWKAARPDCFKAGGEICHVVNKPGECYAAYRGDTAIALIALGATARVLGPSGARQVPIEELFSGKGEAPRTLQPGEILTEILLPPPPQNSAQTYIKVFHRAVDFPLAGVAAQITIENGRCTSARIALGAVESGPLRARQAEQILTSGPYSDQLVEEAAEATRKIAKPVRNMAHGSPSYRRQITGITVRQALRFCASAIGGGAR